MLARGLLEGPRCNAGLLLSRWRVERVLGSMSGGMVEVASVQAMVYRSFFGLPLEAVYVEPSCMICIHLLCTRITLITAALFLLARRVTPGRCRRSGWRAWRRRPRVLLATQQLLVALCRLSWSEKIARVYALEVQDMRIGQDEVRGAIWVRRLN